MVGGSRIWLGLPCVHIESRRGLLRHSAGRQVHPPHQRAHHVSRFATGSGVLRRSAVSRQTRARSRASDRSSGNGPAVRTPGPAGHHHRDLGCQHPVLLAVALSGVDRLRDSGFLGESHFAFLGYAQAFRQTPVKRQIDYLRFLGASKDSAKELKLFGLSKYLTDRFQKLSDDIYVQNVSLAKRGLLASCAALAAYYRGLLRRIRIRHSGNGCGER